MTEISLTHPASNAEIVRRLESLAADAPRQWGKMTPAQMCAHCQKPFEVAAGELKLARGLIGKLFGRMAKKRFVDGPAPFGRNSPTDPHFRIRGEPDFERERDALIEHVRRFGATGPRTIDPHPFFGPMSAEDWDRLLWKHTDHHLRQFGA